MWGRRKYIAELHSIRGIAALVVAVGHALVYYQTPQWFRAIGLTFNGRAAVVLFFVLSGFVLTKSLRSMPVQLKPLSDYYIRRFFRLYPALWFASAMALLYLLFIHRRVAVESIGAGAAHQYRLDRFDLLHLSASFAGMLAYLLPQLWSIFVEIVASVAMPFISFALYRKRRLFLAMLALSSLVSLTVGNRTYYNVGMYQFDFFVGAFIVLITDHDGPVSIPWIRQPGVLATCSLLACFTQFLPADYYSPWAHLVESCLCFVIVTSAVVSDGVRALTSRTFTFLGDISYSVYLLHYTILCAVVRWQAIGTDYLHLRVGTVALSVSAALMTLLLTVPLSWLCFRYVECSGIDAGRAIVRLLGLRSPSQHGATEVMAEAAP